MEAVPEGANRDLKSIREAQRRLWVLDGVLDHGLTPALLEKIVRKYRKIDAVPSHYYQPELFQAKPPK